ncbi:response regulator [Lysinibacillus contaminans]|uniref:Response regulator n=1 Tax=Lysinibacillus contaminans TaxID=1293441 RepID=A0ABR5K051_9BACI|nr:response regulator transcription factor [Lysinibacillus contaminans]KOS67769.1 response regulator [Lysinibacillus contaminans]
MKKRILVVEDDRHMADLIQVRLKKEGYEVECVHDGLKALQVVERCLPDCMLLDWMLPKMEGIEVCRQVRYQHDFPIIMISGRTEELDIVLALELGATDYLTKPFGFRELLTRMRMHMKRFENERKCKEYVSKFSIGPFHIDLIAFKVYKNNLEIPLTQREFKVLLHLMQQPGDIQTREQIIEVLESSKGDRRTVDVIIRRLREKIEKQPSAPKWIKTKNGIGYYFHIDSKEVSYY